MAAPGGDGRAPHLPSWHRSGGGTTRLFHGTSPAGAASIRGSGIKLSRGRYNADFGQGFYLSRERKTAKAAGVRLYGESAVVVEFRVPNAELRKLDGLSFRAPSAGWSDFVRFHRTLKPRILMHGGRRFDFVSGPMFRRFGRGNAVRAWPDCGRHSY